MFKNCIENKETNCWEWQGAKTPAGYGVYRAWGKNYYTHRLAAKEYLDFDINSELHVMHKCDNRSCCNPEHFIIGTNADNVRDKVDKGRQGRYNSLKTHCKREHEFTEENTYINSRGERQCRKCMALRMRTYNYQKVG